MAIDLAIYRRMNAAEQRIDAGSPCACPAMRNGRGRLTQGAEYGAEDPGRHRAHAAGCYETRAVFGTGKNRMAMLSETAQILPGHARNDPTLPLICARRGRAPLRERALMQPLPRESPHPAAC